MLQGKLASVNYVINENNISMITSYHMSPDMILFWLMTLEQADFSV